jgi:hypothetical protein
MMRSRYTMTLSATALIALAACAVGLAFRARRAVRMPTGRLTIGTLPARAIRR